MMPTPNKTPDRRIRAVVTAGSTLAAGQLVRDLSNDPSLQIGVATDIATLWQEIGAIQPAVVLLDTHIAGEKTPQLVNELVQRGNLAVLVRTEPNEASPGMLLDCIDAGALAILNKPESSVHTSHAIPALIWSLKAAGGISTANLNRIRFSNWSPAEGMNSTSIFAIGAGMGGTFVLGKLLAQLPAGSPGAIVIAPLPAQLINPWANHLSETCRVRVKQASEGDIVQPGHVLVAPGDRHVLLRRTGSDWTVKIKDGPAVFNQKPSIEVLFNSIAECGVPGAVGVLLSGAGVDGIAGLLKLRKAGGRTLTETSGIFPELSTRALQCGAAEIGTPANELASKMLEFAATQQMPKAA